MGQKCLVTGAAGGIGRHLCEKLKSLGHEVFKLDIKIGSYHDIRLPSNVNAAFEAFKPEWVFHLAALADVVPSIEKPYEYHRTNVDGTVHVLEAARQYGVKRFIYAASASCYGKDPTSPVFEHDPVNPAYPYALTKYVAEQYVRHYSEVYGVPAISLRLFNVYGPGLRTGGAYGALVGIFLSQLANGLPLTIVGDGQQARDFVFVSDVCEAFVAAANSPLVNEVFNVGSRHPQSVNTLVNLLGNPPSVHIPDRPGEPRMIYADISKIDGWLGWTPKVRFADGVKIMLEHLQDYKNAPLWTPEKIADATREWFRCLK
jgi:UDP-glucose 4-epimerase